MCDEELESQLLRKIHSMKDFIVKCDEIQKQIDEMYIKSTASNKKERFCDDDYNHSTRTLKIKLNSVLELHRNKLCEIRGD